MNFEDTNGWPYGSNFLQANSPTGGFLLSGSLNMHIAGKRLTTDADIQQAVTWLQTIDCGFFYSRIQVLISRWDSFLQFHDDNVEVWCDPSAARAPCKHRSQDKALEITVFVSIFLKLICISSCLLWGWLAMSLSPSLKCFTHHLTLLASMQASPLAHWSLCMYPM